MHLQLHPNHPQLLLPQRYLYRHGLTLKQLSDGRYEDL